MKLKIGTLLLIFILFNSFLLADNIYFGKRNIVWKNSKVISRTDKHVNIQFWERNGTITITKPISSIFGIVESTVDTTSITKIKHFSWDETNIHIKDKSIHSIYYLDQLMGHFNDDIEKEIKLLLESEFTPSDIPQQSNLSGLGLHARNELKTIYNFEGLMSDEERIMHYYSKLRDPKPAAFSNFLGIASIMQKDYEFGFIIMACEVGGALLVANAKKEYTRHIGFTLLDLGLIMSIVRPFDFSQKYNDALKVGLQFK